MRKHENAGINPMSQIDLSTEQTKKIRKLRVTHKESISPLRLQEHQAKAELDIFWLQMTPDTEKIKSAQKKFHDIQFQLLEKETDFRIAMREVLTEKQLSRFLALGGSRCQSRERPGHHPPRPQQQMMH
jgi:Spy/CpxP family protein refolding chaperone